MTESPDYKKTDSDNRGLTVKFLVVGVLATIIIVLLTSAAGYYFLRSYGIEVESSHIARMIKANVSVNNGIINEDKLATQIDTTSAVQQVGEEISLIPSVLDVTLFNIDAKSVWSRSGSLRLDPSEYPVFEAIKELRLACRVMDYAIYDWKAWLSEWQDSKIHLPLFVPVFSNDGSVNVVAKLNINFSSEVLSARKFAMQLFWFVLLGNTLIFLLLYYRFGKSIKTIRIQAEKLNQQITSLSELLDTNKSLQKSMKTASSRAVELNEQFLRRVGADLHDGPAQMIGFAVMRLNKVSQQEEAAKLGQEFHAVKQALEEALDEVRGISSGLVLPELEVMSLEQCLRKVVTLHGAHSDTEVAQYYQGLPEEMPLPIKICAYRFLQEGLNNSERHGQAKKCRVTAHVVNDVLHLSLKDNGMGFRKSLLTTQSGHLGLMGLKDRIESLGGKFSINSELGVGTALKLSLNLHDDN